MRRARISVLFPCHSLEDFPTWLDGDEPRDLFDAWTAAWHPALLAASAALPTVDSLDRPPDDREGTVFIVPAAFDERLAGSGLDAVADGSVIRRAVGRPAIVEAALEAVTVETVRRCPALADDFHALGLAWLLSDLLARRMRSSLGVDHDAFRAAAVTAAEAAIAGDDASALARLTECFESLAAARKRYYPVDIWLLDVVLLAGSTLGDGLAAELALPGSRTLVAPGSLVRRLAETRPDLADRLRGRLAAGEIHAACGLDDDAPIHRMPPEAILASLERSRASWHAVAGVHPTTFARRSGGFSAILPQLLAATGFSGCLYQLFDGSRLPDPGTTRIRLEGPSGTAVEAVSCTPLDARSPQTAAMLADSIGDLLDHSHTAVAMFAHYPGTAERWFDDFRRIAAHADIFGRFVTPEVFFRETAGAGVRADFEPDSFADPPPKIPPGPATPDDDPVARCLAEAQASDRAIADAAAARRGLVAALGGSSSAEATSKQAADIPVPGGSAGQPRGWLGKLFTVRSSPRRDEELLLESPLVAVKVHPETGGILSIRKPGGPNRLSQQLAVRLTRPGKVGTRWEDPLDRSEYSTMAADAIERTGGPRGEEALESRGRLLLADRPIGTFRQKTWLDRGRPLAHVEAEIVLDRPIPMPTEAGRPVESYAASRFAWNENDDVELFRSLHTQSAATERTTFSADHFIELRGADCTILPEGLAWHVRSSPHMLDTLLLAPGRSASMHRFAIGLGLARPWEPVDASPAAADLSASPPARITGGEPIVEGGRTVGIRVGVLESLGTGVLVKLDAPLTIVEAWRTDARGRRERPLAVEDGRVTLELARYEWALVELRVEGSP